MFIIKKRAAVFYDEKNSVYYHFSQKTHAPRAQFGMNGIEKRPSREERSDGRFAVYFTLKTMLAASGETLPAAVRARTSSL